MKRRIFFALDLPEDLKERIAEAITQWRWLPIKWLAPANWHVTLVPPASFDPPALELLVALLRRHRLGGAFEITFSRILLAPPGAPARMIWLGGVAPPELARLKRAIERAWAKEPSLPPFESEARRPFALHATLARFASGDLAALEAKTRVLGEVNFAFEAGEIVVMESHLTRAGAEYEQTAVIPL